MPLPSAGQRCARATVHWFDGVRLDSPGAVQAREQQEQLRALQNDRPPPIASNPASQILSWLAEAEAGRWQAWWQLSYYLMLTPESRAFGDELDYFVTAMPGWGEADESLRRRIVAVSERYLAEAETSADEWLGRVPMPIFRMLSPDCVPSFSSSRCRPRATLASRTKLGGNGRR